MAATTDAAIARTAENNERMSSYLDFGGRSWRTGLQRNFDSKRWQTKEKAVKVSFIPLIAIQRWLV